MFGGARPYGTALLIAGVSDGTTRLFETDPSGTLLEYKATGIGTGRPAVMKVFEEEYRDDAGCKEAILLGLKALSAATEGKFDVNTVEIGIVEQKAGAFRKMAKEEVATFVEQFEKSG
jgi:proteasome alpha subunit